MSTKNFTWKLDRGRDSERRMLWPSTLQWIERHYPHVAIEAIREERRMEEEKKQTSRDQ